MEHTLPALLEAGLCATIHSVDPANLGGYLVDNFVQTFDALPQLGTREAYALARNSLEASFAPSADKVRWVAALDATFAGASRG